MEETPQRFAYRCLPLTIANCFGWEILLPQRVVARWDGGMGLNAIQVAEGAGCAVSHFGAGILTFHPGYLFRTPPGTQLLVRGPANWPRDGISALEGVVETDWLSFTFTMNYKFTRPCEVVFEAGEPFCFVTPIKVSDAQAVQPEILSLESEQEEARRYHEWHRSRLEWNAALARDPNVAAQGWQKFYTRGTHADGNDSETEHLSKLKLSAPIER